MTKKGQWEIYEHHRIGKNHTAVKQVTGLDIAVYIFCFPIYAVIGIFKVIGWLLGILAGGGDKD